MSGGADKADEAEGAPFVSVEVSADGLRAGLWLNGVPVFEEEAGRPRFIQAIVNHWVTDGSNSVQVFLSPSETGGGGTAAFGFKMQRGRFGMETAPDETLLDYRWNSARSPLSAGEMRMVLQRKLPIDHPYDRWRWQGGGKREVTPEDGKAIRKLVATLHRCLAMRNATGFVSHLQLRNQEMARAFDLPFAEVTRELTTGLASFFTSARWTMTPLRDLDADVVLRPLVDGRLVEVLHRDGGPALRGSDGDRRFFFPLMVSFLDDAWVVVR